MAIIEDMGETVGTVRGTLTRAQFESMKKAEKEKAEKAEETPKAKHCELRRGQCKDLCALWTGESCRLFNGGALNVGGLCPVSNEHCGENCALFKDNSCALF